MSLLFLAVAQDMRRFDAGLPARVHEHVVDLSFQVITFPVRPLTRLIGLGSLGRWGYMPFLLNSALWALVLFALGRAFLRR